MLPRKHLRPQRVKPDTNVYRPLIGVFCAFKLPIILTELIMSYRFALSETKICPWLALFILFYKGI